MPDAAYARGFLMNIPAVMVANGLGICLMTMLLLSRRTRTRAAFLDMRLFYGMCWICLLLCALESAGFLMDGRRFPGAWALVRVSNLLVYMLGAGMAFLWVCFVDYKLFKDRARLRRRAPYLAIPMGLVWLMSMANLFVDVFFGVSEQNAYFRTPLFPLLYAVMYGYLTYGAIVLHNAHKRTGGRLYMPAAAFLVPIYGGSVLQLCFYGLALIWVSTAVGLTFLYINLQNEEAFVDPLTGLYNRNYLTHYMSQAKRDVPIMGILLDLNDFKRINDTGGHMEGDRVLREMGKALRALAPGATVVRYGGDEFVVLLENARPEQVQKFRDKLVRRMEAWNRSGGLSSPISLAAGVAQFDAENFERFFREMDLNMYKEKREYYRDMEQREPEGQPIAKGKQREGGGHGGR